MLYVMYNTMVTTTMMMMVLMMMIKQVMDNNFSIGNLLLNNIVLILHKVKFVHDDDNMTTSMNDECDNWKLLPQ